MHKFLKLSTVSILAVMATANANAAGYTCEELIEYTSCNPGYYLLDTTAKGTCPDGYSYGLWCQNDYGEGYGLHDFQEWNYSESECLSDNTSSKNAIWYGEGCMKEDALGLWENTPDSYQSDIFIIAGLACNKCPIGSICSGGTADATPCPAGSYCAEEGLTSVSGVCAKGTYSTGGASACSLCPATGLTDKDGATVVATTAGTGATGGSACYIDDSVKFKDTKGTYHYKSDCGLLNPINIKTEEDCDWLVEMTGEDWIWDGDYCVVYTEEDEEGVFTTVLAPTTESACLNVEGDAGSTEFIDGKCDCNAGTWMIENGVLKCIV